MTADPKPMMGSDRLCCDRLLGQEGTVPTLPHVVGFVINLMRDLNKACKAGTDRTLAL